MVYSGHCLCGQVKYTIDADAPIITGYDHCDDCQRQSGSTYCKLTPAREVHRVRHREEPDVIELSTHLCLT